MKKLFKRKENGDIALISIFASIVILTILALIIDFGLIYYQSARLQNAVDSATVAVAHNLMADDASVKNTVETYMKENGVDITEKGYGAITPGTLTTKITYGDEDAIVLIDKKGLLTEEAEDADDGRYITAGYLKVTVAVKCRGYWSAFSGLTGKQIVKSGYAKCDMQYNDMPEALKYTIFGNSPNTTDDYRKMTVRIDGRTNNTQAVANMFVGIINGINESFVQPIIGAFGGEPNYNTLLNASLSHAIVNGDVHSNSDISIGVNTIQASRAKDADFNGKEEECICSIKCKENSVNGYCSVCQNDYRKCDGDEQTNDDYNQVIFTAVNKIDFSAGKYANNSFIGSVIGSDNDFETRVYVRNFQYVEQTQVVLYVLDQIDFDTITSTETLRSVFTQTATEYFQNSITLPESQRNAILAQADNLEYISKNKYQLNAQKSIVYAASNAMANDVMLAVQSGNTLVNMLQPVLDSGGIDPTATPETLLKYDGTNLDIENSVVTFTKPDSDQTAELYIVDSENTNRSVIDMTKQSLTTASATAGYRFAVAKTFHQFANHIDAPNMKPYFIRAINRSVKNATTTKDSDSTATEYEDAKSVKDAVKKSQTRLVNTINSKKTMATINNGDGTFSKGSADATTDPSAVADGQSDTYIDNTYRTSASVTRQETSPLFRYRLNSTTNDKNKLVTNNDNGKSPYTLIKYGNNDAGHTTYNGVKVFNDEGNLSTAQEVVDDYAQKNNSKYGKNAVDKFEQTDVLVDADADDPSVHDYDNHYGDDAVAKKKHYIENTLMLSEDSKFTDAAPKKEDVFLMSSGTKKSYLEQNITNIKNMAGAIGSTALAIPADLRVDPVASRYRTLIDAAVADLGYTLENSTGISYTGEASISKDYNKPDGTHVHTEYSYEALLPGKDGAVDITVDKILTDTRNDFKINGQTMNQANIVSLVNNKYNEYHQIMNTTGWTPRGSASKNPSGTDFPREGKQMILHDKSVYASIDSAWTTGTFGILSERLGVTIKSGSSVQIKNNFSLDSNDSSTHVVIGDNSDTSKPTYLYVKGEVSVSRCDFTIGDNTTVIVDGNFDVSGGKSIFIGNNSKLIVGGYISSGGQFVVGENTIVVANGKNSSSMSLSVGHLLNTAKESHVYLLADVVKTNSSEALTFGGELFSGGAIYKTGGSGNFVFNNDSITYVGRDVSPEGSGDINLKENAIVVANLPTEWNETKRNDTGVVRATGGKTINMAAGSVLVTLGDLYHRIDASNYNMEPGSLIVTDMVKSGNESNTSWLSNIIAKKIDTFTLVFKKGAHVFCSDEIWIAGSKTIELNNSVKIVAGKNTNGESVSGNSAFTFSNDYNNATEKEFAIGCTGTITGFASGDFVLGRNCFLSAQGLSISNLTINQGGGFIIPYDSSTNTNITNLTVNDGNSTYIGNNLNVSGTITVNADLDLYKVASANSIVVNSGNLIVDTDCTATNITVKGEMNVARTLTCSGTIENQGKLLVGVAPNGSNPGNTGSFSGSSGTINNYGTVQIYGGASFGTVNNKYNTAKSKGSVFYSGVDIFNPATTSITSFNNEASCKVICPDILQIQTAVNNGFVEAGTLSCTSSFTNYQYGQVKLCSATCSGNIINDGIIQSTGTFSVSGAVNNTKNIRLDDGCTVTGKITNSGNIQVTGKDANLADVDNSGNISVYGQLISSGTYINRNFTCTASQSKIYRLQNSGTFSTTLLNRNGSTESNIINTGTLELHSTSSSASSNVTSIDNSGDFVSNRSVYTGNLVNTGKLEVFESLESSNNITNSAKLYAHKSIKASSTINNNSNGSTGESNSTIYAGMGNGSNYAIYAESINNGANIVVGSDDIYVTNMFAVLQSSIVCVINGGIDTNDFEVNADCALSYSDDLNIRNAFINKSNLLLTDIKAKIVQNEGVMFIDSGNKDFEIQYLINTSSGKLAFDSNGKDLVITSQNGSVSLKNEGKMFVNGDLVCHGAFHSIGGEAYIYGDLDAANSVAFNNAGIYLEEDAQLYVYGNVPTNAAGNGVYIKAKTDDTLPNAVYSVYGKGNTINSGTINSDQPSSKLYFGGNVEVSTTNNTQTIKGQSFFYGKYTCASTMDFNIESEGLVYIADNVDAQETTVRVKSSGLYCYGSSIKFKNIYGDAGRIYLINLPISQYTGVSGVINLSNASMIYIPKGVTLPDGKLIMTDDCLDLSDPTTIIPISNDNFAKANSGFVTSGNVRVLQSTLTIPEGSTLCVGGNLFLLGTNARIVVNGSLYVTGKIYYSDSAAPSTVISKEISTFDNVKFDDLITMGGQNAEMFIGKTKSGTVNLRNQLNLYGNQKLYMENNLSTTGNLTNSQTSKGGIGSGSLVPNRGESVIIEGNSKAYISGDFFTNGPNNNLGNAVYVAKDASLSCGGNLYNDSAIYNYGTFFVFGEMVNYKKADGTEASDARKYSSDKKETDRNYEGISLLNGNEGARTARFFVGGHLKDGTVSQKTIIFEGYAQNWGTVNIAQPVWIKGHRVNGKTWVRVIGENGDVSYGTRSYTAGSGAKYENAPRFSWVAEQASHANFGNHVALLGGYIGYNADSTGALENMPVFSTEGDCTYGMGIMNGGIFYAKGAVGYTGRTGHTLNNTEMTGNDAYSDYYINHIEVFYFASSGAEGDKKGSYSILNGYTYYPDRKTGTCPQNNKAVFYAGSSVQVGYSENSTGNEIGGSVSNWGDMYINGSLKVYSNKEYSINMIALSAQPNSRTVIAGSAFSSGGFVTMRNALFMCDGDLITKRCARIGVSELVTSDDDIGYSSYTYVGGNMVTSTNGTGGNGDLGSGLGINIASWNYLDIFSNANIYVGGSFFTNSIFHPFQNVTIVVDGKDKGKVNTSTNFITWLQTIANGVSLSISGYNKDDFKFIVNDRFDVQKTRAEGRTTSMFDRYYIHGSVYLNGRAKIADMSKFYVYGNFVNRTDLIVKLSSFEVGRALDVNNDGDTWASKGTFVDSNDEPRTIRDGSGNYILNPDYDYNYANATYVYVEDTLDVDRQMDVYPGTTIKIGKNYKLFGRVKLDHDTRLYCGGKIDSKRYIDVGQYADLFAKGGISAWNYVVIREHAMLYSGGDVKCGTTYEGKTASTTYTEGSLKATLSNIKIRDESTAFVSGNMSAFSYIELGKKDESYKDNLRKPEDPSSGNVCTCSSRCTGSGDEQHDGDCPVCKSDYSRCTGPLECICESECTSESYNADCPVCNANIAECKHVNPETIEGAQCTCKDTRCTSAKADCPVCSTDYSKCEVGGEETILENDITRDLTDSANGGDFYIGRALISYTSYIRQYGFSSALVGRYVFANRYLTLRSNSDMWVLPEAFNNDTYKHVDKTFESDGTILGDIIKFIKETAFKVQDKLSLKNGSIYSMGDMTLNKNASVMGTHDCYVFGQATLLHDSLMYFGHDVKFYGPSFDLSGIFTGNFTGFTAAGDVYTTMKCNNKAKHPSGYTIYTKNYDPTKSYVCDKCGAALSKKTVREAVTCPVTIYANNDLVMATSVNMSLCYAVACNGDVTISDPYSSNTYDDRNLYQLPNAIASYNGNITYATMYGKIAALFYAPSGNSTPEKTVGNVKLDGFYQEVWGSIIGDTVTVDTFYINLHRFNNWRTMDLQIAESGNVYLISKEEYDKYVNNVDEAFMTSGNTEDETKGGASLFFDKDILDKGEVSGGGLEQTTN